MATEESPHLPCQTRPEYSFSPIGSFHGSSDKTRPPSLETSVSPSVFFFPYFAKMSINVLELKMAPYFDLSHILLLRCGARWRQAVYPPFPENKTDGENGCRLKIGTVPSWRKTVYFGLCKWIVPCRNGLIRHSVKNLACRADILPHLNGILKTCMWFVTNKIDSRSIVRGFPCLQTLGYCDCAVRTGIHTTRDIWKFFQTAEA